MVAMVVLTVAVMVGDGCDEGVDSGSNGGWWL